MIDLLGLHRADHTQLVRDAGEGSVRFRAAVAADRLLPTLTGRFVERARVDRPRASRHGHAFERSEAHRRIDRTALADGREGGAGAEVADDRALARVGALVGALVAGLLVATTNLDP
mgnify:CR=1 FL=1